MARTRKSIQPLNLYKYDVLIEDKNTRSEYFKVTQFDGYFYGGRNAFLLAGAQVLKPNTSILVEVLNQDGTTVYSAPVSNFIEGGSRLVQVEVYDDTPIGIGKIVLLACAEYYIDGTPIPDEWKNKYNVRWITDVIISPLVRNKTPIRFFDPPNLLAKEKFYLTPLTASFSQSISTSANFELTPKYYTVFQNGYLIKTISPTFEYSNKFLGGKITGSIQFVTSDGPETASINLPITKIYNSTLAETVANLIVTNKNNILQQGIISSSGQYITRIEPFGEIGVTSSITINYDKIISFDTEESSSYIELRFADLGTISGEIYKTRISYKSATTPSNYTLIGDIPVEVKELLAVDTGSKIAEIGKFASVKLDDYWYAATMSVSRNDINPIMPSYYLTSSNNNYLPIKQRSNDLLDAIDAVPPIVNAAYQSNSYFIGTKPSASVLLFPRSEYTLMFDALVSKISSSIEWSGNDATLEVYLVQESGSIAKLLETNPKGQLLGTLTPSNNFQKQRFDLIQFNFTPKIIIDGTFGLRFLAYGGFWNIANVSLKPATEPFFNSDESLLLLPNEFKSNDLLIFKAEYLDVNNNSTSVVTYSLPTYFTGSASTAGSSISASYAATASVGLVANAINIISGSIGSLQTQYTGSFSGSLTGSVTTASYTPGIASVAFVINGGSTVISTGFKGSLRIPSNVILSDVALYTSGSGSINIDIRRYNHSTFEPMSSSGTSIVGTPLSMSNNTKYRDTILSGWTTALSTGDILNFFVSESSGNDLRVATVVFDIRR